MALPRFIARVFSILLCLIGLAIAPGAGLVAAYQLAKITPRIGILVTTTCLVCFLFTLAVAAVAIRLWIIDWRKAPWFAVQL
jgi:hypothetical protein